MADDPTRTDPVHLRDAASALTAVWVPGAGMIGTSLRDGGTELLGQRRGLAAYVDAGKTMGIPFLHPWANRLSGRSYTAAGLSVELADGAPGVRLDPSGLPIHGLLAALPDWRVEPRDGGAPVDGLAASFDLRDRPDLLASFPFPHEVELRVSLRDHRLTVETTITPTADVPVPLAFGFHPYVQLPSPREGWRVSLPAMRHRPVDERGLPTGTGSPVASESFTLGDRTFDDGYDELAPDARFVVEDAERRITVGFDAGYPAAQVFAPATDPVICFEPMAAPTDALVSGDGLRFAMPGEPFTARFWIDVEA